MKLSDIQEMWESDSRIDEHNLSSESLRIPMLHAKYLNILSSQKLSRRKTESDYLRLRRNKQKYYKGEMSKEELDDLEWQQYLGPKLLKTDIENYIESDDDIIRLIDRLEYIDTMIFTLESIVKSINSRSFDIRNAIEWQKFQSGVN